MEASVIYHDGEEVEVGWFGLMLYRLRGFWRTCKQTDWKNYFQGNGPGEVTWKEFTGFRENPNDLGCSAQWCICVKGGIRMRDGNYYYRNITVSDLVRFMIALAHSSRCLTKEFRPSLSTHKPQRITIRVTPAKK